MYMYGDVQTWHNHRVMCYTEYLSAPKDFHKLSSLVSSKEDCKSHHHFFF